MSRRAYGHLETLDSWQWKDLRNVEVHELEAHNSRLATTLESKFAQSKYRTGNEKIEEM